MNKLAQLFRLLLRPPTLSGLVGSTLSASQGRRWIEAERVEVAGVLLLSSGSSRIVRN